MVQYVLIFGVVGVFFAALYQGATDDVGDRITSYGDRLDLYKAQAAEHLALVEMTDDKPATADLINTGAKDIRIRHLYVDGVIGRCVRRSGTGTGPSTSCAWAAWSASPRPLTAARSPSSPRAAGSSGLASDGGDKDADAISPVWGDISPRP